MAHPAPGDGPLDWREKLIWKERESLKTFTTGASAEQIAEHMREFYEWAEWINGQPDEAEPN